jgi:ATP-binding cassette, subfamily A (ABC1), member 3
VVLIQFETSSIGLTFSNVSRNFENFNFSIGLIMLFVDTVLWFAVGVYLEAILPKEFGQRRHPCFCFYKRRNIQKTQDVV